MARTLVLSALAILALALTVAGCGGDKKVFFTNPPAAPPPAAPVTSNHPIPVISGLSGQAAMTDGKTPAGADIRLQVSGHSFLSGAEVRLRAKAGPGAFDTSIAAVDSTGEFLAIDPANVQFHDQIRIDVVNLPASPIAANSGQGTVVVEVVNPDGNVNTDGTSDGSATHDELTYYATIGLQATITQAGRLAGAWSFIYPGQSGIELQATLTNMSTEPVHGITVSRALSWSGAHDAHILNYVVQEPAGSLGVGASTTVRYLAATTNELPPGATTASVSWQAVGSTSGGVYSGGASDLTLTAGSAPTINTRGGNNAQPGGTGGAGGLMHVVATDEAGDADPSSLTLGAQTSITPFADLSSGFATSQTQPEATADILQSENVTITMTQAHYYIGETIEIHREDDPDANRTWVFEGPHDVVFRDSTIAWVGTDAPGNLTITTSGTVQFINTQIVLRDRRTNQSIPQASGNLSVTACNDLPGRLDIQNSTFDTSGARGFSAPSDAGFLQALLLDDTDDNELRVTNSRFFARGTSMPIHPGGALPGGGAASNGGNAVRSTLRGPAFFDAATVVDTSGGDALTFTSAAGGHGGLVFLRAGFMEESNIRQLVFDGTLTTRGGDALDASAGNGGGVVLVGRAISLGNPDGRPVLLANGGSNALVASAAVGPLALLRGAGPAPAVRRAGLRRQRIYTPCDAVAEARQPRPLRSVRASTYDPSAQALASLR